MARRRQHERRNSTVSYAAMWAAALLVVSSSSTTAVDAFSSPSSLPLIYLRQSLYRRQQQRRSILQQVSRATTTTKDAATAAAAVVVQQPEERSSSSSSLSAKTRTTTATTVPNNNNTNQKRSYNRHKRLKAAPAKASNIDAEREIVRLGRRGRTDAALQLFREQRVPTLRQYNAAIDACARARPVPRVDAAFELVEELQQLSQQSQQSKSSLKPNVYTYGALMNCLARAGQVDAAVRLLRQTMPANGVEPNTVVYQSAVAAAAHAVPPRPDAARRLLEEAAQNKNIALTIVGYNAAVAAAARAGDCAAAVNWLEKLQSDPTLPDPDAVTYGTVLAACESAQEWHLLLQKVEEFGSDRILAAANDDRDRNNNINNHTSTTVLLDSQSLMCALHACQQLGLAERAVHYLELMKKTAQVENNDERRPRRRYSNNSSSKQQQPQQGPDAVAYRMAISACARGRAWRDGIRLLDEYLQHFPRTASTDTVAYTAAVTGCEYAGEWQAAVALLKRMRAAGAAPNCVTLAAVMGACATACANLRTGNNKSNNNKSATATTPPAPLQKALQLLHVMRKDDTVVPPNVPVYNAAIRACAEGLDLPRAFQLEQLMREQDELQPTVVTYGTLMTACERVGRADAVSRVFRLMRQQRVAPNEIVYGAALSCCRKAGEAERAYRLLRKMVDEDGLRPNAATFNTVLMAQAESTSNNQRERDLDRAVSIFRIMTNTTATAAATDDESSSSTTSSSRRPNRQTYSILIRMLARNRKPREAEALLRRMRDRHNDWMVPDVDLYTLTVAAYERLGQPRQALRLMEAMRADGYDFYETKVLDAAFKRVVKLVANTVAGTSGSGHKRTPGGGKDDSSDDGDDDDDDDDEPILFRNETGTMTPL